MVSTIGTAVSSSVRTTNISYHMSLRYEPVPVDLNLVDLNLFYFDPGDLWPNIVS